MCQIFPTLCGKQVQETRVASASKEESLWEQLKQLSVYSEGYITFCRFAKISQGFEDRKFNSILDAIRLNLASEESIVERFPSLVDSWKQTQLQYQLLCCGIQVRPLPARLIVDRKHIMMFVLNLRMKNGTEIQGSSARS